MRMKLDERFAVILDELLGPDDWAMFNKPFPHVRVGHNILEELQAKEILTSEDLTRIFDREVYPEPGSFGSVDVPICEPDVLRKTINAIDYSVFEPKKLEGDENG